MKSNCCYSSLADLTLSRNLIIGRAGINLILSLLSTLVLAAPQRHTQREGVLELDIEPIPCDLACLT